MQEQILLHFCVKDQGSAKERRASSLGMIACRVADGVRLNAGCGTRQVQGGAQSEHEQSHRQAS